MNKTRLFRAIYIRSRTQTRHRITLINKEQGLEVRSLQKEN